MCTLFSASFARPLLTAVLLVGAAGCHRGDRSADEPRDTRSGAAATATGNPFPVNYDDWAKLGYRLDWVGFPFPGSSRSGRAPVMKVFDDCVVLQKSDSTLTLLEAGTGKTRWSTQVAGTLTKFVGINRDPINTNNLLVSSESEVFTVSVANGSLIGRDRFNRVVNTSPIIENGIAIYGCSTGEVMGHVVGRGVKAWGFLSGGAIEAEPADMGSVAAFVNQAGEVLFFSKAGGLAGRGKIFDGLSNNPVADGGMLFIAGRDRSVWALDAGGNELWRHRTSTPLTAQPTAHKGVLYETIPGDGLTAFDEGSGKVLWNNKAVSGTVVATNHGSLLVQGDQRLVTLNPADGSVIADVATPGIVKVMPGAFDDGAVYAVSDRAMVAKFNVR